jgi:hypothetical protein
VICSVLTQVAEPGGGNVHFDGPLAFPADDLLFATSEIMPTKLIVWASAEATVLRQRRRRRVS